MRLKDFIGEAKKKQDDWHLQTSFPKYAGAVKLASFEGEDE